jgi:hypothetical protein
MVDDGDVMFRLCSPHVSRYGRGREDEDEDEDSHVYIATDIATSNICLSCYHIPAVQITYFYI